MSIEERVAAPHLIVDGEIDADTGAELRSAIDRLLATGPPTSRLEIDLGAVTFIDSSGLGALVGIRNAAARVGASLALVSLSPSVARMFELTGLWDSFAITTRSKEQL